MLSWRRGLTGRVSVSLAATLLLFVRGIFTASQHERLEAAFLACSRLITIAASVASANC